eukprot:7851605-Ditylum_brightwellii.AAC.1
MKKLYYRLLKEHVLDAPEFRCKYPGTLGTHSTRKFGMTRCRQNGCHKDEGNCCGHFYVQKRVLDKYCNTTLPWVNAKTTVALCICNLCAYELKEGIGVTDVWINQYGCPSIRTIYSKGTATLFGKTVLWAIFNEYNKIPSHHSIADGENPIAKHHLVVWEYKGAPYSDTIQEDESQECRSDGGRLLGCALWIINMVAMQQVQRNVSCIAIQSVICPAQAVGAEEYRHDIGSRKAACHFQGMRDVTKDSAIDKIYSVYGAVSVTNIIQKIRNDEPNGGHPELN